MVAIGGCSMPVEREIAPPATYLGHVIKSPADTRDYRHLTLDSGLKVLLISDPDTDKAAAAVDVGVGSYNDPDNRLGLAHFLEHMLFLGNKKYPEVDGYFQYIKANGGSANAYTADVRTNYFFDINSDKLQPALDQLAQFFVSPTLDPSYVDRERHAVDSEYQLHTREDGWRLLTALNATSNPEHPKSRFSIGNLETLNNEDGQSLWKDLKAFYDRYYVAENIGVVVYGKESTDTLEKWGRASFKGLPAHQSPDTAIGVTPYTSKELGVRINVVPLKETRVLSLNFPMESVYPYYKKKPLGYLARLLGYEGKGSLHSLLKEQGLIDSLAAYSSDVPNEYSEFAVRMELTPKGLDKVDEISAMVFDYLDLIRREGLLKRLYDESHDIAQLGFRFQEDRSPQQTVSALAARMHYLPAENILDANYLYEQYDPELIGQFLDKMTPENLRQVVIAQGLETDKVEPYFDTHYSVRPLNAALVKRLNTPKRQAGLTIPAPNTFIANDFEMRHKDASVKEPRHIVHKPGIDVWSMTDTSFTMPRANVRIKLTTPAASDSPESIVLLQLYRALLSRSLNEYGYPAKEAGLYYSIAAGREGMMISLAGYQDKQSTLLKDILAGVEQFNPDKQAFLQERAQLIRGLKNKAFQPPYRLGMDALNQVIYRNYPDDETLLKAAESVTFESLVGYVRAFFNTGHIEMLVHGNHSQQEAQALARMVEATLMKKAGERYSDPYNLLTDQSRVYELNVKHNDSVFIAYYQRPETDNHERARYALLGRLLATPFFNSLRTEQQLGYVVLAGARPVEKHPGMIFVVQSPKLDPLGLEARVDTFLKQQKDRMAKLTEEELKQYQQGLMGDLLKRDANLDERGSRFWQAINSQETFDNREKIAEEISKMTVADMQQALATLLEGKGRLVVRSFGEGHQQAKKDLVDDTVCHDLSCFNDLPRGR
ncbi:insulinase family protein [Endozoicomonas sp. Mp262]|uniref:insulinase family protein n=1 Tax=Endozoicomonas sp. Mp262 TaxID=2919499 RepID=UPI0021DABF1A